MTGIRRSGNGSKIETYERLHPELLDEAAKVFKVKGYFIAIQKGDRRPQKAETAKAAWTNATEEGEEGERQ